MKRVLLLGLIALLPACTPRGPYIYLGQGLMSGEITASSAILQTRLTATDTLVDHDLPGMIGWAGFEVDVSADFSDPIRTEIVKARTGTDFIVKQKVDGLRPNTTYHYRVLYGHDPDWLHYGPGASFRTLPGAQSTAPLSFAVVTGMNYYKFHYGDYDPDGAYRGPDKSLGYPALAALMALAPDYFVGTGDNVYFDHPEEGAFQKGIKAGKEPNPGHFGGKAVRDEKGMRQKYHVQFSQPRFREFFAHTGTYWEKDDHDYRFNDADPYMELPISHALGIANFREQLPVTDPSDPEARTYRTHHMNRDLQVWLLEGRDYRSPNDMEPGPEKTLLGAEQIAWLKESLLESDAAFKIIISPTPWVGPDDMYKSDNHVNPKGFRHEGDALFSWLLDNGFLDKGLYLVCGDRHWKYHATHPSGFEEFSCGALVDANARAGRLAGDPNSTDPEGRIIQYFIESNPGEASGGFLLVSTAREEGLPTLRFSFYNEKGQLLYEHQKSAP